MPARTLAHASGPMMTRTQAKDDSSEAVHRCINVSGPPCQPLWSAKRLMLGWGNWMSRPAALVSGATAISPSPRKGQANSVGGVEAVYPQPISYYLKFGP